MEKDRCPQHASAKRRQGRGRALAFHEEKIERHNKDIQHHPVVQEVCDLLPAFCLPDGPLFGVSLPPALRYTNTRFSNMNFEPLALRSLGEGG